MKKKNKLMLRGAGSLMNIAPRPMFLRDLPHKTAAERMSDRWQRIGESFRRVMVDFPNEPDSKQSPRESSR